MRHFRFNKLIRDKLPSIICQEGVDLVYKKINGEELVHRLKEKLKEEVEEVVSSKDNSQLLEELADLTEIIQTLISAVGETPENLENIRQSKYDAKGGFEDGVFVDKVSLPEDSPMLFFYLDQPEKYPEIRE